MANTTTLYLVKLNPDVRDARGEPKFVAVIGRIVEVSGGYRFLPQTSAHKASRKVWPTRNSCIPRWTEKLGFLTLWEKHELNAAVGNRCPSCGSLYAKGDCGGMPTPRLKDGVPWDGDAFSGY